MKALVRLFRLLALNILFMLLASSVFAAGIKVAPSIDRVAPGESFFFDIVAENVPALGLGTVQFRLNVNADDSPVAGVPDLGQSADSAVNVASPLLMSAPTATRSGLGELFLDLYQGDNGILVMDNESINGGSALYTYAHTSGANLPSGSGSVARFYVNVGSRVAAEKIQINLTEVMLIDGGEEYPLDFNLGATVTLRCSVATPDLNGLSLAEAQSALTAAGLSLGNIYEIANPGNALTHDVVLEQSVAAGAFAECETALDLAINQAPDEVINLEASDLSGDDTGQVVLTWTATDASGYRIYYGSTELAEITDSQINTITVGSLPIGSAEQLTVTTYDSFGNESAGASVTVTALDDVPPVVAFKNVTDGSFYTTPVQPQLDPDESHPASQIATLNGNGYDWSLIDVDGIYTLEVTITDTSDNSTTESISFTVDQNAPVITVPNVADGAYLSQLITPEIVIEDMSADDSQTVVTLNGQPYIPGTAIEGEDAYTLTIEATDKAGNQSSLTVSFELDFSAPTIVISDLANAYYNSSVTPQISIDDANLAESSITLNGAAFNSGETIADEDVYALVVSATDAAGNEATQTLNFTIDLTDPVITFADVTSGAFYSSAVTPSVAFADVALDQSSLSLNGAPYVSGTPITDEGAYTLTASANDLAGNQSEQTLSFTIDITKPVIVVTGVSDGDIFNRDITPEITISDLNLDETSVLMNGAAFVSATTISAESTYLLTANATDLAGNSAEVSLSFMIDKTKPVSSLNLGVPQYQNESVLYVAGNATVALNATDAGPASSGVAAISYALDGADLWNAYTDRFDLSSLSEGSHSLTYKAQDVAGNLEDELLLAMTVDNSAPETALAVDGAQHDDGDSLFVTGVTRFTMTASDAYSGVAATQYRIDDADWIAYAPFTTSGDGLHSIAYRSSDKLGHVEATKSFNITVDDTAPVTAIVVGLPKHQAAEALYVSSTSEFTLTASDATAGIEVTQYRIDGGDWIAYAPFSIATDGAHEIEYRSRDQVGNLEAAQSLSVIIDNSAPVTSISADQPQYTDENGLFVTAQTQFTISAEDALSGVAVIEYRLDQGAWSEFAPFSIAAQGPHTIAYRAVNNLGSVAATQTLSVSVDNTAPVTTATTGEPRYSADGNLYVSAATVIELSASDHLSGVDQIQYQIDGDSWQNYATALSLTGLADGAHTLNYRALDHLANQEEIKSLTLVLDNTTPETAISLDGAQFTADDGSLYVSGNSRFNLTATDALSGVANSEYRIDAGEWLAYAPFNVSGEGQRLIEYRSNDNLDNQEAIQSLRVIVDNTAPETAATAGNPQHQSENTLYVTDSCPITLDVTDASSGAKQTEYRLDAGDWQRYEQPLTLAGQVDGPHSVGYRSVDQLGNLEEEQLLTLTLDNSAPVSELSNGQPQFSAADGSLFVTAATSFAINANDDFAGVASIEYRIDAGDWLAYAPFNLLTDGEHQISWRSRDNLGNNETVQTLALTVDNTAPITEINLAEPQHTDNDGLLFITGSTMLTLTAQDDRSGVAISEYRIDNGDWTNYAPFTIADEGPHRIDFRSYDNVSNLETAGSLSLIVDNYAPVSEIEISEPKHVDAQDMLYITAASLFSLSAEDDWAGVAAIDYRIDSGDWIAAAPFTIAQEGEHQIEYRSTDLVGNAEDVATLTVTVDNTAPTSAISFETQSFIDGETLLLSAASQITLTAEDTLAGVAALYYRYDDETVWQTYSSAFQANELAFGDHVAHFYSIDTVGNVEEAQSVTFTLIGAEVNVELLNLPRVLVWTEDPAETHGKNAAEHTLDDVSALIANAMGSADAYVEMVTDQDLFQQQFRSGLFNVVMVLNQNVPFNANFLREMRDAVENGGIGLLISSWGNNVHPVLQEMLGLDFVGSMSMEQDQRELFLFESELSAQTSLTAYGRILKTRMDGGSVVGIVPAESQCSGIESVTLSYPEAVDAGSRLNVSVYTQRGKKLTLVDAEQIDVNAASSAGVNSDSGNPVGDLSINEVSSEGVTFTLAAPYGYLESDYLVAVTIEGADGSTVETGAVAISPTCSANLMPGMQIGPFSLTSVADDKVETGDDLPAVVLNQYGDGRAVFVAYNIIDSAMNDDAQAHANLLGNATNYLLPEMSQVEPAGIVLVETTISFAGAAVELLAVEQLEQGLTHLPLFDLTQSPLEYRFNLEAGEEATYRYFVSLPDQIGAYVKQTELHLKLDETLVPYDTYSYLLAVTTDSDALLQQAITMVDLLTEQEPSHAAALTEITAGLESIAALPMVTSADYAAAIDAAAKIVQDVEALSFNSDDLQKTLNDYLRILRRVGA